MSIRFRTRRWLPSRSLARRSRGLVLGGVLLRVRARRSVAALDRLLASGTDPMLSDALSLRVGQLGATGTSSRLALALRSAVQMASGRRAPLITTRLRRAEISKNEALLLALADRLGEGQPLGVPGLAMTARLVHDRESPLYRSGRSASLRAAVTEALAALERGHWTAGATGH
jgi:hypothetical protein